MKKVSVLNYAFAVGKIRALERFLIRQQVFEEAMEAGLNEVLRLFVESDLYSEDLLHVQDSAQLESVLDREFLNLKELIGNLLLDKQLLVLLDIDSPHCAKNVIKNYQSEFLENYLRHLIDMHNIKSFLRLYVLGEPQEKLAKFLTCEGFIKIEDFLKLYTQDIAAFLNRLEYTHRHYRVIDYTLFLGDAIQKAVKDRSFIVLEKAINDFLISVLKPAMYLTFGPEPVLAYYFAKVNEINLIRMIILSKFNEVPNSLVKERLNSVYA